VEWYTLLAMMIEGVRLMAVGMTAVFAFLGVLVVMMYASASIFSRWALEPSAAGDASSTSTNTITANDAIAAASVVEERQLIEIAVALAAIEAHRQQQGG